MIRLVAGALIILFGMPFLVRGWLFSLKPEHPMTLKARERNLRLGMEVDMVRWGRRVRRFGLLLVIIGGVLVGFGYTSLGAS